MANEKLFTTKAAEYAAGRPSYAPRAIEKIFSELVSKDGKNADIGSGTGIFAKEFIKRGYDVYCVEPNDAMRSEAEKRFSGSPYFHSVAASAENTGLTEHSISLITAASAFHWFDVRGFYRECKRILKPDGIVGIIVNERIYDDFTQRQHELCEKYCHSFSSLAHSALETMELIKGFNGNFAVERFDFPLCYSKAAFVSRSLSSSYAPEKGTAEYDGYVRSLKALMDDNFEGDGITVANQTLMLWGKLQ